MIIIQHPIISKPNDRKCFIKDYISPNNDLVFDSVRYLIAFQILKEFDRDARMTPHIQFLYNIDINLGPSNKF